MTTETTPLAVFISYARADRRHMAAVRGLIRGLVERSAVYVDADSLRAGQRWEDQLLTAITGCGVFVVIWSWRARESTWVEREVAAALALAARGKPIKIVPVLVDQTPLSPGLAPYQAIPANSDDQPGSSAWEYAGAVTGILGLAAATVGARLIARRDLIVGAGLLSMWVLIAAFSALRGMHAPWNKSTGLRAMFLWVLRTRASTLVILMLGSAADALLAAALATIQ